MTNPYRLEVRPSRLKLQLQGGMWLILLVSVFCWQDGIMPWQMGVQCGAAALVVWTAWQQIVQQRHADRHWVLSLSEEGDWQQLLPAQDKAFIMGPNGRISDWLLWIDLRNKFDTASSEVQWVFRDQVTPRDYRRLCRIIRRVQYSVQQNSERGL